MIKLSFLIAFSIASILTGISNNLIDSGSKSTDDEKKVVWVLVWEDNFDYEGYKMKAQVLKPGHLTNRSTLY